MKRICARFLIVSVALCLDVSAPAAVVFSLQETDQQTVPGSVITFHATIENKSSANVYLNSDVVNQSGDWSQLDFNDEAFFTNIPWPLPPGTQWSGALFDITIHPSAAAGPYPASFFIYGGADESAYDLLGSQYFLVNVSAVPEPANTGLAAVLFLLLAAPLCGRCRLKT